MTWASCLPNKTVVFLSRDETLEIHRVLLRRFGGPAGVRDTGLLESTHCCPRTGHFADTAEMAAALFESPIMNRTCVDGNKRVALFATGVLLRINGYQLKLDANKCTPVPYRATDNQSLQL